MLVHGAKSYCSSRISLLMAVDIHVCIIDVKGKILVHMAIFEREFKNISLYRLI